MRELALQRRVVELLEAGRTFCRARLLRIRGSAPQRPGAGMIVHPDGAIEGTIGGGRFEAMVIYDAVRSIEAGERVELCTYDLTRESLGMYCAGQAEVLLEVLCPEDRLVIFGGGHVGQALGRLASDVGTFHVTVVDDRAEFATRERHPTVDRVVHTDEGYERGLPPLDRETYCVIVTRCHDVDRTLVKRLAPLELAYLGMIGSEPKVRRMWLELEREGVAATDLEGIHAPIGLPVGGKAPGEIGISILAQVLQVREARRAAEIPAHEPEAALAPGNASDA